MQFFGKSDEELKRLQTELQQREEDVNKRENRLSSEQAKYDHEKELLEEAREQFESEREEFRSEVNGFHLANAKETAKIEKRFIELSKQESAAKTKYAEQQREAFKEVIESRITELDTRQRELDAAEDQLAGRYKELHTEQAEVARRELAVTEREQKADAGFADKAKALAEETARHHQANQAEAERLRAQADALAADRQQFELEKAEWVKREQAIRVAEHHRDAGFADERAALDSELFEKRRKAESDISAYRSGQLATMEEEFGILRTKRLAEIAAAENVERDRIRAEIAEERMAWVKQSESERKQLEALRLELEKKAGEVAALQSELEGRKVELEARERTQENYKKYAEVFRKIPCIRLMEYDETECNNFQYIVIEVDPLSPVSRDLLIRILHAERIIARRYFYPGCHQMEPYRQMYPDAAARLANTETLANSVIILPTGTSITKVDIELIGSIIKFALENGEAIHKRDLALENTH